MLFIFCVIFILNTIRCSDIYHERTKIEFSPDAISDYFGYSVLLDKTGLIVGAPKAKNRDQDISSGLVFRCKLNDLSNTNSTCYPIGKDNPGVIRRTSSLKEFYVNDMWFGATMATVPNGKLLVCAPRWSMKLGQNHLLATGACYLDNSARQISFNPLNEPHRYAYRSDGLRREFGEYGSHLNFYAYGQAGMSVKVVGNNSFIIGAPGLLQWAGGIVDYTYNPDHNSMYLNKEFIANPYFTLDLKPDDYLGYSVESGIFDASGTILYVGGAPRSTGFGQVFIFKPPVAENEALAILAKLKGPQLGSYFGSSLCCLDINNDGRIDLLVGAPNHVRMNGELGYDQGAVYVYVNRVKGRSGFEMQKTGYVSGSETSGARFGTAIAELGDIDGDGFKDVAIGAPWENNGNGVVYIYRGYRKGLRPEYSQRIVGENTKSFGISISKGLDVDANNCSDLAIGAFDVNKAYLYRCVPTIELHASIKVPDAMNLPQNATNFTALFCVSAPSNTIWSHVQVDLNARITVDPELNRAQVTGDSEFKMKIKPGIDRCEEMTIEVKPTAELSKPITLKFILEETDFKDTSPFPWTVARLSDNSTLSSKFDIQLTRDCGPDLICIPWLKINMSTYVNPYIPGTDTKLGVAITVLNEEEPAYGAAIHMTLPLIPKRLPSDCSLQELNMTCNVPAPLYRNEQVTWDIELEYNLKTSYETRFKIVAFLEDPLFNRNISNNTVIEEELVIIPQSEYKISGKALPNVTIPISRDKLSEGSVIPFLHYYEVTNHGPSDSFNILYNIDIPKEVTLSNPGLCNVTAFGYQCSNSFPAKVSSPLILHLRFDLSKHGNVLEELNEVNFTTTVTLFFDEFDISNVTTTLVLDPATPIWPIIVGSIAGVVLLALIVYVMYRYGFFSRKQHEDLKRLKEENNLDGADPSSSSQSANESSQELLDDSD